MPDTYYETATGAGLICPTGPGSMGYKAWNVDRWSNARYATSASSASPTGYLISSRIVIPQTITIAGFMDVMMLINGGGESGVYVGLYNPTGGLVASSSDRTGDNFWATVTLGVTTLTAGNYRVVSMAATQGSSYNGAEAIGGSLAANSTIAPAESGASYDSLRVSYVSGSYTSLPPNLPTTGWTAWYMNIGGYIR